MARFGIITSMASRNMPGYDLMAHSQDGSCKCRISVKYRRAENSDGFIVRDDIDYDIFIGVWGNSGKVSSSDFYYGQDCGIPRVFIITKALVDGHMKRKAPQSETNGTTILSLKTILNELPESENNWQAVLDGLR